MADAGDAVIGALVEMAFALIMGGVIYRFICVPLGLPKQHKVLPFQRGVLMKGEKVDRILEPGTHWISPKRTFFLCDVRPKAFQLNSQDVRFADGRWVRVSLRGETRIVDAAPYVTSSSDSLSMLYVELRRLLSEAAGMQLLHHGAGDGSILTAKLRELLGQEAARLGMAVVSLDVWEMIPLYPLKTEEEDIQQLPLQ
jgi:SPFH domain / Band 7 family